MRRLTQTRRLDAAIADLAGRQHGLVTRGQLGRLGLAESGIDRRLRARRLHRVHRGVYAVGHRLLPVEGRWLAAVLASGPGAVLSGRSAGALWGISNTRLEAVEVSTPRKTRSLGAIRRHCVRLPADETTIERGIPTTTVPRTLLDLAAVLDADRLERAMREAEVRRLYDTLSLPDLLKRHRRHRGNVRLRACLERLGLQGGATREELEARFLSLVRRRALPLPALNAWIDLGDVRFQVDCLWRRAAVVAELDGHRVHGTRAAFESDRERDRRLQAAGWTVLRITWRQLDRNPSNVIRDLSLLLDRGRPTSRRVRM